MPSCLQNIVSANFGCDDPVVSSSGYDLADAPEISSVNLSKIANEDYISGANLAKKKLQFALLEVSNDFLGILSGNNIIPSLNEKIYDSTEFNPAITYPAKSVERGFSLYKSKGSKGSLRKLKIKSISVYPLADKANAEVKIYDSGTVAIYTIDLIANQINTINVDYTVNGSFARILMDGTDMPVGSAHLTCMVGCNGTTPNDCAFTKGYNGTDEVSGKEGFGLGITFQCQCDYDNLLCSLSKTYAGKIIWLKARLLLAKEAKYTNRLNNWTVYNRDRLDDLIQDIEQEYVSEWNTFVGSLPNILKSYRDDCLDCRQSRWVQNI